MGGIIIGRGGLRARRAARGLVLVLAALVALGTVPALTGVAAAADPCAVPVNKIACENSKPGAPQSDWRVDGYYGDIMGYGTATSVPVGGSMSFKVDTPATAYHIEIYRLGWYGGNGARLISMVNPSAKLPRTQPACLYDNSSGMTDCGNWGVSATWAVPSTAVSGYYVANFIRDDASGASQFPFIVRDDSSTSALLVQASDETWQAYNTYGGSNLYGGNFAGTPDSRAYKVSYNRPYENSGTANFMNAELPMLRWLERNGYDVSYISGTDTEASPAMLHQHRVFISSGHDEYWAGVQRTNVENAVAAGVNLAFFSGNEMFWKTRFEPSISAGTAANRTLVCYKETKAGAKIDPSPEWTGTWRDPRLSPPSDGGRPENAVTGTLFRVNGYANDAITIGSQFSSLRFWRNTAVASLAAGKVVTLPTGTLGYEWDEDADNGVRPAGSLDMSSTTVARTDGLVLQDYGNTYGDGRATHSLTLYRAASGALVFGAGSVQWSWGLDDLHLFPGPAVDRNVQQATVNLFADMGAQPSTLQSGLVAASKTTDTTGPTTTITAPANGGTVPALAQQQITGTARDTGGVVAAVEVSLDGGKTYTRATPTGTNGSWATWTFAWTPQAPGAATIKARASDDSANVGALAMAAVTIGQEVCPCTLFGGTVPTVTDALDASPVELGTRFTPTTAGSATAIRFYKSTANTGTHTGSLWSGSGQRLATGTFTNETASGWQTLTLASPVSLTAGTTYVISYTTTTGHYAADQGYFTGKGAGQAPLTAPASSVAAPNGVFANGSGFPADGYQDTNYWVDVVFSSAPGGKDTTPPAVTVKTPADGATGVDPGAAATASFSEPVSAAGLQFALTGPTGTALPGTTTLSADGLTATFTPTSALSASTTYTSSVRAADLSGNLMTAATSWTFTTGAAAAGTGTTVFGNKTPTTASANDGGGVELGMRVVPSINAKVTGVRFYKGTGNSGTHTGSLWSVTGQRLATGTFSGETASGWQTLTFATPIAVTVGQPYIVSYHAPAGHYAADQGYFTGKGAGTPPIMAPASSATAGNGLYVYGTGGFPTDTYKDTNYWVDVVLDTTGSTPDSQPPAVTATTPAAGATAAAASTVVQAQFSEPVSSTGLRVSMTGPGGTAVAGATALAADSRSLSFTPTAALSASTSYTVSVQASDLSGNAMAGPYTWSFTTAAPADTTPPAVTSTNPATGATSVPVTGAFTATMSEPVAATGLQVTLTSSAGSAVAGVPSLSADGLTVTFTPSAALAPSTAYTASLKATDRAGNVMATPTTWSFTTAAPPDTTPPMVTAVTPTADATGVRVTDPVTATFSEPVNPATFSGGLTGPDGTVVAGTVAESTDGRSLTFTPSSRLALSTKYTESLRASDVAGNVMATPYTWSFTTAAALDTTPPTVVSASPGSGSRGAQPGAPVSATFSEPVSSTGLQVSLTGPGGTPVSGTTALSANGMTVLFTPSASLAVSTAYTASVRATDRSGNAMPAATTWSFTTAAAACPCTVLGTAVPKTADAGDANGVELGMRFVPTANAVVTGVRFYKSAANSGTHTGSLWSASGQRLATGTFTGEIATGWQTLTFATPVPVTAGTTYLVSYLAPSGHYAADTGYFTGNTVTTGVLSAPAATATAGNGVYHYGGGFPTDSYLDANYYVDVVVTTDGADTTPPVVTGRTPASGATGVPVSQDLSVSFSEPVASSGLAVSLTGPGGSAVTADTSLSADGRTAAVAPRSDLAAATVYAVTVRASDVAGNAMAPVTWSFTTAAAATVSCPCSLFRSSDIPASTANEGTPVSLGMTWTPSVNGVVRAIRFYKVGGDTGTHTGSLFGLDGSVLATGTFSGETASGWQTLTLAIPAAVTAGTSYVAAYSTPQGRFGYSVGYFSSSRSAGPLTAPANSATVANGRWTYAAGSPYPVSSGTGSNYYVDVVFSPS